MTVNESLVNVKHYPRLFLAEIKLAVIREELLARLLLCVSRDVKKRRFCRHGNGVNIITHDPCRFKKIVPCLGDRKPEAVINGLVEISCRLPP